jgi:Ni,Fe-hydrogenase maturation factor
VARAVAARAAAVSVLQRAMLVPELAEPVARADLVVFVDARPGGAVATLALDPLEPLEPASLSHVTDPRALLALAARLFGRCPPAWIVTVPAFDLAIGEGLSSATAAAVDEATGAVLRLLRQ